MDAKIVLALRTLKILHLDLRNHPVTPTGKQFNLRSHDNPFRRGYPQPGIVTTLNHRDTFKQCASANNGDNVNHQLFGNVFDVVALQPNAADIHVE